MFRRVLFVPKSLRLRLAPVESLVVQAKPYAAGRTGAVRLERVCRRESLAGLTCVFRRSPDLVQASQRLDSR